MYIPLSSLPLTVPISLWKYNTNSKKYLLFFQIYWIAIFNNIIPQEIIDLEQSLTTDLNFIFRKLSSTRDFEAHGNLITIKLEISIFYITPERKRAAGWHNRYYPLIYFPADKKGRVGMKGKVFFFSFHECTKAKGRLYWSKLRAAYPDPVPESFK